MIPDAAISCCYLLLGSGCCAYRWFIYCSDSVSKFLPHVISASFGIAAVGARSTHALVYNLFWRSYPIDPMLIAKELEGLKDKNNIVDWVLSKAGTAAIVYSLYYRYELVTTGALVVAALTFFETLYFIQDVTSTNQVSNDLLPSPANT